MAMNHTGFFHHIGTFLLFAATVFLIITDISAPVVRDISILKVKLTESSGGSEVSFGTFGYCILDASGRGNHICSAPGIGYSPADVMREVTGTEFSSASTNTTAALTKVMILHPVATGIAFIAFIMALGAGVMGSFLASIVSALAFIVTLVALICDFVSFAVIKSAVDSQSGDAYAYYSVAMWTILASAICSFLATIVVFFTCCSGRLHRRRQRNKVEGYSSPPVAATPRRRWWSRRRA